MLFAAPVTVSVADHKACKRDHWAGSNERPGYPPQEPGGEGETIVQPPRSINIFRLLANPALYAGHETSRFHIGGADNAFRLPQGAEDGRCAVEVKMNGELEEVGSWTGVKLAIHELITICGDGSATKTWTGYMNTGINGRLRVEIRKGAGVQAQVQ